MRRKHLEYETKSGPLAFLHKTSRVTVTSYRLATGGWVPKAWVNSSPEDKEQGQPVVDDLHHPLPTKDAADAVAKKLAIEWIDLQFPSAAD